MTHRLKNLVLVLVATCAVGALLAPIVQAGQFHIGTAPAVLQGHSDPKEGGGSQIATFAFQGAKFPLNFECPTVSLEAATQGKLVQDLALTPTFGPECTLTEDPEEEIGAILQVLMNGCKFLFTGKGIETPSTGVVDIAGCTVGKRIQLKAAGCTYEIPEQSGLSHVVLKSTGANEVTMEWTLSGITVTQSSGFCLLDPIGHVTSVATFFGNTVLKAFESEGTEEFVHLGHQYDKNLAGEQVSLSST